MANKIIMQRSSAKRPKAITLTKIVKDEKIQILEEGSPEVKTLQVDNPISQQNRVIDSPTSPFSPTRRKRAPTFMTQKRVSDVEQAFSELNNYIDVIDEKVMKLVEKHEAEFLVAYRNHVKRVREEMDQIKRKAMSNADSSVSHAEKIDTLEKQLTIFRQESLKLFEKLSEKEKTVYYLQSKISELESEKAHLEQSLRTLTKRNKHLQGSKMSELRNIQNSSVSDINKQFQIHRPTPIDPSEENAFVSNYNIALGSNSLIKNRPYTTAINSKGTSIRTRNQSIQLVRPEKMSVIEVGLKMGRIEELLTGVDKDIATKLKQQIESILNANEKQSRIIQNEFRATFQSRRPSMGSKQSKSFIDSKIKANKSELEEFFYQSIETVRKQITRRRGLKSLNFYKQYSNLSLSEFKKVDFFRILELLVANDRVIATLHQAIFEEANRFM